MCLRRMRGCGIDREGVVHYQNTDAEDCGHLQVTAECRLAPFKECTESMFLSAIIDSAILRTCKIISRNFESTPQFSISTPGHVQEYLSHVCSNDWVAINNRF
jgi:hypothetical protein